MKNKPRSPKSEVRSPKKNKSNLEPRASNIGFTLVELLAAVAVIAVGMVFVLGAFSQCVSALNTVEKRTAANFLLNRKMWEIDAGVQTITAEPDSLEGRAEGDFDPPHEGFHWTVTESPSSSGADEGTASSDEGLFLRCLKIAWTQGKHARDFTVTRYVRK